ncbi:MAG TPA: NTP transferase domain-containing protein [Gemmatimonadales bacterium]
MPSSSPRAAGRGRRLGDLGTGMPKCLLPINGRSSLDLYASAFERAGVIDEVIVVGGYRINDVRNSLPAGFRLIDNPDYATTNSLASLALALQSIPADDDIAVFNADVIYQPDLLGRFVRSPRRTAMLIDELRDHDPNEYQVRVVDGMIARLSPLIPPEESFGQDAQAFRIAPEHLPLVRDFVQQELDGGGRTTLYSGWVLTMLAKQGLLHPVYTNGQMWSEFDTAHDYQRCVELATAEEGRTPFFGSYGLDDTAPVTNADEDVVELAQLERRSFGSLARRTWDAVAHGKLPWRLQWLAELPAALRASPRRALRWMMPLATRSMTRESFRLQVHGARMMADVMDAAAEVGIRPYLMWGTLLGCIREGGFIRGDHDVDLGVADGEFERIPELTALMLAREYTLRAETDTKVSFIHPKVPLWIDLDRLVESRDHFWIPDPPGQNAFRHAYWFPRPSFETLSVRRFEGVDVFVPDGAEEILTAIYGTWWIPQQKRHFQRGPLNLMMQEQPVGSVVER